MLAEEERAAGAVPIYVLDGALGTVLEELPSNPASTSLWSAGLLKSSPETLKDVNRRYIRAGADIAETATYQCSFEGFEENGIHEDEAVRLMRLAVNLTRGAIDEQASENKRDVKLALSLGPYGATLRPGCEYTGKYPPPFALNTEDPKAPREHLKAWHKRRLDVFLRDDETWDKIDIVAFETVPRLDEVVVLREIMEELEFQGKGKEWWISCVFPEGNFPDGNTIGDILKEFSGDNATSKYPRGIGINCTKLKYLSELPDAFNNANKELFSANPSTRKPFIVMYPDGGQTYDPVSRTWSDKDDDGEGADDAWAAALTKAAQDLRNTKLWDKVIIGGCCKAAYSKIEALRRLVDAAHGSQGTS